MDAARAGTYLMMHMHHDPTSPLDLSCICTALRKASRAVTRTYDEAMEGTGMTIVQFSILRQLARHGNMPLSRLAELLVMDRTTLYRALGPIDRHGWVAIGQGAGRAKIATLSAAGRQAMADATGGWERAQRALVERFGVPRWRAMEQDLQGLVAAIREDGA